MIPKETVDRIYEAAKIEEVVGDYVKLHRRGANLIGLCPFHTEKTGSFTVSPSKGIYKCFGCGASGHAVGFIKEIEQCSYSEALKQVARKYHIEIQERELTPEEQQRQDNRESMFVVNEASNQWFQQQLWDTRDGQAIGLSYLRQRGLQDETIRTFQLGYSPEKGNPLSKHLAQQGFREEFMVNDPETGIGTGVVGRSQQEGKTQLYDRFRDRVIFPFFTVSGKTVAFAGRIMRAKDNTGKYVNSPESLIFSKRKELYGIFQAKQEISRKNLCYLVEGQMDVISMHQSGIHNVVASGGTALTREQIQLIKRFTSNITVLYDGDAAGIHAALRGIDMFLEAGFNVKVVLLPDGEDPDSFSRTHNATDFIAFIAERQTDFIRFKTDLLRAEAHNDPQQRAQLIKDITQSIACIPDKITRQVYITDTAERMQINEQLLIREVISIIRQRHPLTPSKEGGHQTPPSEEGEQPLLEKGLEKGLGDVQDRGVVSQLWENFRNLIQLVVRYGDYPLYALENNGTISTGNYIISQLENDGIAAPTPLFARMLAEFKAHEHDDGFRADAFFKYHEDKDISQMAIDMIADKYQLSRIFLRQNVSENTTVERKQEKESDHLPELVNRLMLELKYTVICQRIEDMNESLKQAEQGGDWELQRTILMNQPQLLEVKNQICRQLGNRIITV